MNKLQNIRYVGITKMFPTLFFLILAIGLSRVQTVQAGENYSVPDFAFPQTVEKSSRSLMNREISEGNEIAALREAMNVIISENILKGDESLSSSISLLDSLVPNLTGLNPNLCRLLEAELLSGAYSANRYIYDNRHLPVEPPFPNDELEWSGEMFRIRILECVTEATAGIEDSVPEVIDRIKLLLTDCEPAQKYGMTVNEFLSIKGAGILSQYAYGTTQTLIPFYPSQQASTINGKCNSKAKEMLSEVISSTSSNSVVKAWAIKDYVKLLPDEEKEKELNKYLEKLKGTEGEGILLYDLWNSYGRDNFNYYTIIKDYTDKWPKGYNSGQLQVILEEMESRKIEVSLPGISLPDTQIEGSVSVNNITQGYLLLFKLNSDEVDNYDSLILKKFRSNAKPIEVIDLTSTLEIPFQYEKEVRLKGLESGIYAVIPSEGKTLPKDWAKSNNRASYSTIRVSEISLLTWVDSRASGSGRLYVVKGKDQQPVEGAKVTYFREDGRGMTPHTLVTNNEGWVPMPNGYYRIEANYKGNVARTTAGFSYYSENSLETPYLSFLTDLEVYRPGDTVGYAIVGWLQEDRVNRLVKGERAAVTLRDANYNIVSTDTLILDGSGRANGNFKLPEDRLLGRYQLTGNFPDRKNPGGGSISFYVEDYKLPGFLVTMNQEKSSDLEKIEFEGIAQTYSGMPVGDASVEVKVTYQPWRWWNRGENASYTETSTTDSEGKFKITLPLKGLEGTIFEKGRYTIKAQVTSPSGETQSSSPLVFSIGKGFEIRPDIPDKVEVAGDSVTFRIPVYDIAGLPTIIPVEYKFINDDLKTDTISGIFNAPVLEIPADKLSSGRYRILLKSPETGDAVATETIIWRRTEETAPYPTPLWIPENQYVYDESQKSVEVTFGSYWNDWILYSISDGDKTIETGWLSPQDSLGQLGRLNHFSVTIPDPGSTLFISLAGMHDLLPETGEIKIVPQKSLEKLSITATSFRENVTAGDEEDWEFNFKISGKEAPFVNVFAVMSDQALNALYDFKWNLNIWQPMPYSSVRVYSRGPGHSITYKNFSKTNSRYTYPALLIPNWQTYGYPFISRQQLFLESNRLYKSRAQVSNAMSSVLMDTASKKESSVMEEAADEAVATGQMSDDSENNINATDNIQLRPVEMPLAFFKPDLRADSTGTLNLKFHVPDFNTTWQLQLAGYTDDLLTATYVMEAIASKAVMVKTNLPQFLRTGDKAQISATIFNNTCSPNEVGGKIEIVDPSSGKVIAQRSYSPVDLAPSGSEVLNIEFDVPSDCSYVACLSYAFDSKFNDGEQGYIVVLPSSTPVVEATTFYANSQDEIIEVDVPKLPKNSNVTIKYCDNPLWEVLLAMPGFTDDCNSSSLSIARWLYATLTASSILERNPDIKEGLEKILTASDSVLTKSKLSKDGELKIAALQATPWINNANRETERIRSLKKYLDDETVSRLADEKISALKKLQESDGGWTWFEGMKSSPFITSQIIKILGYLNDKDLLPSDMEVMAQRSVRYYDSWLVENERKYHSINVEGTLDYLYSRGKLGFPMNSGMEKIEKSVLDSVAKRWKYYSPGKKAEAALVLSQHKKYRDAAKMIMASLEEFTNAKTTLCDEAMMLEAFEKLSPESLACEKVRESIYLRKETEDWGTNPDNVSLIYSLVNSAPVDVTARSLPEIFVGAKRLEFSKEESLIGCFTMNVDPSYVSGKKLLIKRSSGVPGWGGVFSQYVAEIQDVKKVNVENLSIDKHIYKMEADGSVKEVKTFEKGDKVSIVLNLEVGKDMEYVALVDSRSSCLSVDDQGSGIIFKDGLIMYRENRFSTTSFFIENLRAGKYVLSYDCHVDRSGVYSVGIAEVQCLYSPAQVAHSGGRRIVSR